MPVSKILKFALPVVIVALAYLLIDSINRPIRFEREKKKRYKLVISNLRDIRTAELAYKSVNGKFTNDFDSLFNFVKNDSFRVVRKIGSADDTTAVQVRDTFYVKVIDSLFRSGEILDSMKYIPFSGGEKFELHAGEIEKGNVMVKVFQVFAPNKHILKGLDYSNYVKASDGLKVGSMNEPSTSGNWE